MTSTTTTAAVPRASGRLVATDAGSGSVLVLAVVAVAVVLGSTVALLGSAQVSRVRAQSAADLTALAAADAVVVPAGLVLADAEAPGRACDRATQVAARNEVSLATCVALPDGTVQVSVTLGAGVVTVSAIARAGPASARG